ncbi:putative histidine phosphatase superfamily, clade-1 [Plasmopara halstedii]
MPFDPDIFYASSHLGHRHLLSCIISKYHANEPPTMFLNLFCALLLVKTSVHGQPATSSHYRYVPGYFLQGLPDQPVPPSYPPHMGLLDGKKWQDVQAELAVERPGGAQVKLVVFLRHGEGIHNVAMEKYGGEAWNAYYTKLPEFIDSPLTDKGIQQAENASTILNTEISEGLLLNHVLVSPLERALRTFTVAYQNQSANINHFSLELPREMLGIHTCDQRRKISEKRLQYPQLEFCGFESDEDLLWTPNYRESDAEIDIRATKFLDTIFNLPSKNVGVVSHSVFGASLLRVIGHRAYTIGTAEFLPLLIEKTTTI